jgi:hypothetical protein
MTQSTKLSIQGITPSVNSETRVQKARRLFNLCHPDAAAFCNEQHFFGCHVKLLWMQFEAKSMFKSVAGADITTLKRASLKKKRDSNNLRIIVQEAGCGGKLLPTPIGHRVVGG